MVDLAKLAYLAVEDDLRSRQILGLLLGRMIGSNQILILENSQDFPEKLAALPFLPAVIFLDIAVKPFDGYQMLAFIRQRTLFDECKIIAVTARVMSDEIQKMKTTGFDGMIGKPLIRQIFPELIQRIINGDSIWYIA